MIVATAAAVAIQQNVNLIEFRFVEIMASLPDLNSNVQFTLVRGPHLPAGAKCPQRRQEPASAVQTINAQLTAYRFRQFLQEKHDSTQDLSLIHI